MSKVKVTNRSTSKIVYKVQMDNGNVLRREFNSGETREVNSEELERLTWTAGGRTLIMNYLLIQDPATVKEISQHTEPEYWMKEENVKELLLHGTQNEFLDCLDFAPEGVLDLIKKYAVDLQINDIQKRTAIFEKLGFDVTKAIENMKPEEEPKKEEKPVRREAAPTEPKRRSAPKKYEIVNKE